MTSRRGFTIVELLTVITIIGVLASIAIPKFHATRERAVVASMISDLRNILTSQEGFYSANDDYAGGITTGPEQPGQGGSGRISFSPSSGNVVMLGRRTQGGSVGWWATVRNPRVTLAATDICGVYVGHASFAPDAAVIRDGLPICY